MKFNNIIKGMMVGVLALSLASCQDFLDRPSEDSYNTSNFYQNDAQCLQGVNYLYNSPWYDFIRGYFKVGEIMSGNMFQDSSPYMTFTTNATDGDLVAMSYSLWAVNGHANTIIKNVQASEGPSQEVKNQVIGEALTLKALAYFYMVRSFGEVPIIHNNSELLSADYNSLYKHPRHNIYEYIIYTLEEAMKLLPKKNGNWDNRVDYYAAEALLAKTYLTKAGVSGTLNQEDLENAAKYAKDVIDNSGRYLNPNYEDIFRLESTKYNVGGEPLISWMWVTGGNWTAQNSLQSDLGVVGFSQGVGSEWGSWTSPSVDLMDAFGVSPLDEPNVRKSEKDIRRKASIMMIGDVYPYFWQKDGGFDLLRFIYEDSEYGSWSSGTFDGPTGCQNVKHLYGSQYDHENAGLGLPAAMSYTLPTHVLRLGDIYLVYAEAAYLTGKQDIALDYVNKIRARAGADALTSLTIEDIWKERRLELAGEGDYWYDFVRRSYYASDAAIAEIKAQRRSAITGYNDIAKKYHEEGEWDASAATYSETYDNPNVTLSSFTLPLANEDVVNNPNLLEPAQEVDVRATYVYNF